MPEKIYLVPAEGLLVRDPVTMEPLPAEGALKNINSFWQRRLNDGDVVVGKPAAKPRRPAGED